MNIIRKKNNKKHLKMPQKGAKEGKNLQKLIKCGIIKSVRVKKLKGECILFLLKS